MSPGAALVVFRRTTPHAPCRRHCRLVLHCASDCAGQIHMWGAAWRPCRPQPRRTGQGLVLLGAEHGEDGMHASAGTASLQGEGAAAAVRRVPYRGRRGGRGRGQPGEHPAARDRVGRLQVTQRRAGGRAGERPVRTPGIWQAARCCPPAPPLPPTTTIVHACSSPSVKRDSERADLVAKEPLMRGGWAATAQLQSQRASLCQTPQKTSCHTHGKSSLSAVYMFQSRSPSFDGNVSQAQSQSNLRSVGRREGWVSNLGPQ